MGVAEEAGKVASGAMTALSGAPMVLGLVLINMMFLGVILYATERQGARKDELLAKLATECVVPKQTERRQ